MQGSVTVHMNASAEAVWNLVSDITQIGKYSPETFEAEWLGGATGPVVGAKFRGHVKRNGRGPVYWAKCEVTSSIPSQEFGFAVGTAAKPLNNWKYEIAAMPDGGVDVTESFTLPQSAFTKIYASLFGKARGETNRKGMQQTLERIKAVAETIA